MKARCDALVEALREQIPEAVFVRPAGWLLPLARPRQGTDTKALLAESKAEGVAFVAGPDFMMSGGENSLRLSFAPVPAACAAGTGANERRRLFWPPSIMKSGPATKATPCSLASGNRAGVSVPSARSIQKK